MLGYRVRSPPSFQLHSLPQLLAELVMDYFRNQVSELNKVNQRGLPPYPVRTRSWQYSNFKFTLAENEAQLMSPVGCVEAKEKPYRPSWRTWRTSKTLRPLSGHLSGMDETCRSSKSCGSSPSKPFRAHTRPSGKVVSAIQYLRSQQKTSLELEQHVGFSGPSAP